MNYARIGLISCPWILIPLLLLLSCVPRHAGLTSHSLRHHGPHRPPDDEEEKGATLPELVVRPHEEVVLACDSSSPLVWKHNGKTVQRGSNSGGVRLMSDQLRIARVTSQEEGVWQCEERDAKTGAVLSTRAVWLILMAPPGQPYLVVDGERKTRVKTRENTALAVRCVVDGGRPAPSSLDWILVGPDGIEESLSNLSSPLQSEFAPSERQFHAASELRLDKVPRTLHNSTLVCSATHIALPAPLNSTLRLDVQYSPSFAISRDPGFGFPLREGLSVSLKCDVDSNPPSSPIWLKDDGEPPVPQSADGFLNFTEISREHIGWYKCSADHLLGRFASIGYFLNIRYDPELTQQPPRQVEVSLGGGVTLQCGGGEDGTIQGATAAATAAANCWGRVTAEGRLEPAGVGPDLRLDNILYEEAGAYRCVPANRKDLSERRALTPPDIEVVVTGRPVVYLTRRNLTAVGGSQLSLSVEFCANPPASHTFWVTETIVLRSGQEGGGYIAQNLTAGDSPHCQRAALTIPGVQSFHAGEYLFVVRSPRGMAEGAVRLNVTRGASSYSGGWSGNVPSSSSSSSINSNRGVSSSGTNSAAVVPVRESTNAGSSREKVETVAEEPKLPSKPDLTESSSGTSTMELKFVLLLTVQSVALLSILA